MYARAFTSHVPNCLETYQLPVFLTLNTERTLLTILYYFKMMTIVGPQLCEHACKSVLGLDACMGSPAVTVCSSLTITKGRTEKSTVATVSAATVVKRAGTEGE